MDPPEVMLRSERIYIVPTPAGVLFGLMLVTMLAGAMNYNNNLGFALTFLLAGLGVAAIYHGHRALAGMRLRYLGAEPVFAGDPLEVRFALDNDAAQLRPDVVLQWTGGGAVAADIAPRASVTLALHLPTSRRGPVPLPALQVSTRAPLGLTRTWCWLHLEEQPLVYPRPAAQAIALPHAEAGARPGRGPQGTEDFEGLRAWRPGDPPRRIAWRPYASRDVLLVREFRGGQEEKPRWIEWDHQPASDDETRVARLTRLVLDAFAGQAPWGLAVPGVRIAPARGTGHLHQCLRCLATVGLPGQARP
jgi:uncharacterized protein (DUF58 family)